MAHILIDGYNLIGIAHRELEKARNAIIERLHRYASLKGHDITIVFDGWKDGKPAETKMRIGSVNIIYSRLGEKADLVIKKILSEERKPWIVVSSDREIADFAGRKGFGSITAAEFEERLSSSTGMTAPEEETDAAKDNDDLYEKPAKQKGNPRKPSKKLKQKLRAIKNL